MGTYMLESLLKIVISSLKSLFESGVSPIDVAWHAHRCTRGKECIRTVSGTRSSYTIRVLASKGKVWACLLTTVISG